jgi:hypothetical protein
MNTANRKRAPKATPMPLARILELFENQFRAMVSMYRDDTASVFAEFVLDEAVRGEEEKAGHEFADQYQHGIRGKEAAKMMHMLPGFQRRNAGEINDLPKTRKTLWRAMGQGWTAYGSREVSDELAVALRRKVQLSDREKKEFDATLRDIMSRFMHGNRNTLRRFLASLTPEDGPEVVQAALFAGARYLSSEVIPLLKGMKEKELD